MSTTYSADIDDDDTPMVVEPDESRHFTADLPPRRRPGRYGPTGRVQFHEYADEDYEYDWADVRIFDTFEEAKGRAERLAAEEQET